MSTMGTDVAKVLGHFLGTDTVANDALPGPRHLDNAWAKVKDQLSQLPGNLPYMGAFSVPAHLRTNSCTQYTRELRIRKAKAILTMIVSEFSEVHAGTVVRHYGKLFSRTGI
jgi:hypothetical protein